MLHFFSKVKKQWPIVLGIAMMLSVLMYYWIFNRGLQVFNYDMMEQGIRFVQRGWDLIRTPFTFWDWNHYFGASVFHHGFYFLFSPFWLIYALSPSKELIPYLFLDVNMLKHILLFLSSYFYFKSLTKDNLSALAGSFIVTFSGFALGYYNYAHFTDVLLFIPLILHFIERYLENRKFNLFFIFLIAIIAIINAYLAILFTSYIFLYTIFRYYILYPKAPIKQWLRDGSFFLFLYGLGLLIASFSLVPNLFILLQSPRISSVGSFFETISKLDLYRYLSSFLQPIVDRNDFNPLISKTIVPSFGHSGGAAVYSLILTPLLLTQVFVIQIKRSYKLAIAIFYFFLCGVALFPHLYFFLQGNSDTRWMVMFIFLNAYIISLVISHRSEINKSLLWINSSILIVVLYGAYYLSHRWGLQSQELYYEIAKRNILIEMSLILIYAISFSFIKSSKLLTIFISLLLVLEGYFSLYNIFFNPVPSIAIPNSELASYQISDTSLIDSIKANDNSIYRIDALENYAFNNPMGKNYMGFTFYSSVYNYDNDLFIRNHLSSGGGWVVGSNPGKWHYKTMFGSKYWFDETGLYRPSYGYYYEMSVPYGSHNVEVYENNYPVPLVFTQSQSITLNEWLNLSAIDKDRIMINHVVLEGESKSTLDFVDKQQKLIDFSTDTQYHFDSIQSKVVLSVSFPRSEEVSLDFYLDDVLVDHFYSFEPQYSSVYIEKDFNRVDAHVTNLYGVPENEFINSLYIDYPGQYYSDWYSQFEKGFAMDLKISTNSIEGSINVLRDTDWIVTSIAYDPNWVMWVDGKKVELKKVNAGFLGFQTSQGLHSFVARYIPKDFYLGLGLSIVGLTMAVFFHFRYRKVS